MNERVLEGNFVRLGRNMLKLSPTGGDLTDKELRKFKANFGASPKICSILWRRLDPECNITIRIGGKPRPKHLLWGLHLMRVYSEGDVSTVICSSDADTFSKWAWIFIDEIALLESKVILFENRWKGDQGHRAKISVDGTDCSIPEPSPFSPRWYSIKFRGPGLRYEVALGIISGDIVWINGPFPAGEWPDLAIIRAGLLNFLDEDECVEVDRGYMDGKDGRLMTPTNVNHNGIVRARHETVNGRLKNWNILKVRFRHNREKHGNAFRAVVVVTQLEIENGEPLFALDYNPNPLAHIVR